MHLTVQQLSSALDGALAGPSLELAVRHLAACHECRDRQARLTRQDDALRRLLAQAPPEAFLDDLTRRSEALVTAITRGMPAPVMVTSVPLLNEEDPYAAVEPPAPRPRPELGRSGEMAREAGFGRIGVKPSASTQAPKSDPVEAQRLLEALEGGNAGDFTELTAQGLREHVEMDGPVFDVPAWIKDPSRRAGAASERATEVPKLDVYFEHPGEADAGLARGAADEGLRRDDPPLWPDALPELDSTPEDFRLPPRSAQRPPAVFEPASLDPGAWAKPMTAPLDHEARLRPRARRRARGADHSLALALSSVGGLLAIVFALQLAPAAPQRPMGEDSMLLLGVRIPRVRFVRHDSGVSEPARPPSQVRLASTLPPIEQVLPPLTPPDTAAAIEPMSTDSTEISWPVAPPGARDGRLPVGPQRETSSSGNATAPHPPGSSVAPPARAPAANASTPGTASSKPGLSTQPADEHKWPLMCGQIEDVDGMPVPGARVSVTDLAFAIRTDARGRFCLSAPPGPHILLIETLGHSAHREAAKFAAGAADLLIRLRD